METGDTNTVILDLRDIDPVEHHARLFRALDALAPNEHLKLITHYNAERYQQDLHATHPDQFTWEAQESDAPDWIVLLTRIPQHQDTPH